MNGIGNNNKRLKVLIILKSHDLYTAVLLEQSSKMVTPFKHWEHAVIQSHHLYLEFNLPYCCFFLISFFIIFFAMV